MIRTELDMINFMENHDMIESQDADHARACCLAGPHLIRKRVI